MSTLKNCKRNKSNSKNTGIQLKEIHDNHSHMFCCATAQQEKSDMFMKIGWLIKKTGYLLTTAGAGGDPCLMSHLLKVSSKTPNSWSRQKKHLTFKRTASISACMRNTLKQSHCVCVRCLAWINVSPKHAWGGHRLARSACYHRSEES